MKSSPRHRLTATTAAAALCVGAALVPGTVAASVSADSAGSVSPDHHRGCVTLDVVDRSVNVLYVRDGDHHLIESRAELWQFPEGTISYLGLEDRNAMATSQPLHSRVRGTSGVYAGKSGWMDWTAHGDSIENNWTTEHFVLCGG